MHLLDNQKNSRRAFLRRSGQLALAGTALPMALNLAAMGEAAAFDATDYKALVCVFMVGGNDYANTVVAYDDLHYNQYQAIRTNIALGKAPLAPTLLQPSVALANGRQYALHPAMSRMAGLFNTGKAAVQLNVGPLVRPLTRAQYDSGNRVQYPMPPSLFSHNDQQSIWQSSSPEGSTVGWGGNIGDLALAGNRTSLFTCISVTGNAVFLSGDSALQYQVSPKGAVGINCIKDPVYGSSAVQAALANMVQQPRGHVLENIYTAATARSVLAESKITSALAGATLATPFPSDNPLADQLKMLARLIAARRSEERV